ncbi:MAG: hypothetical protein J0H55_08995 [Chitinophagaceae bacterium]|nr:hypothetical protein [Chitinophagaceae bacterium]
MDRDSHIDNLIKQTLKGEGLEMPPVDFSNKVMDRISKTSMENIYKPIISKRIFLSVLAGAVLVVLVTILLVKDPPSGTISTLNHFLDRIPDFHFRISLPPYILYSALGILVMVLVQTIFIGKIYRRMFR